MAFVLHVATRPSDATDRVIIGDDRGGDSDLALHYLVARAHGRSLQGPQPAKLIGEIGRVQVLHRLRDELVWGLQHGDEKYAVLNACRANVYAAEARIVSKIDGARWAQVHLSEFQPMIARAAAAQRGGTPLGAVTPEALYFVTEIIESLDRVLKEEASRPCTVRAERNGNGSRDGEGTV